MKTVLAILGLAALAAAGAVLYLLFRKPAAAPASGIKVEITPARLERGKYLFEVLGHCDSCHSPRDFTKFAGPVIPGLQGQGHVMPPELGLPGTVVAPNITPDVETGIGSWTDGEKIRAIREGISKDGRALFPMMPYQFYRSMSEEDAHALVAFMNTLPAKKNPLPRSKLNFPVNVLIKGAPQPVSSAPLPDRNNRLEYGKYLVTVGACAGCHTQEDGGKLNKDMLFAGGREFRIGPYLVNSANITFDPETGLGSWSEERLIAKFKGFRSFDGGSAPAASQANFGIMPWIGMSRLHEDDLRAMYAYLRTLPAKQNAVTVHPEYAPSN